jgi:diguanylate cyclase (GGDEF)-like protein/PAS domain S-box-containing protein
MSSTRARRARVLAAPALVAAAVLALIAMALLGSHRDARSELEQRFTDRAASTASLVDAMLRSTAVATAEELGGRPPDLRRLEASVRSSQVVYALVAGEDGRVIAATGRAPAAAAAHAGRAAEQLGFPGAPPYLLRPAGAEGRALLEIAIVFRAGGRKRVHLSAVPARSWEGLFGPVLKRALRSADTRVLIHDAAGRTFGAAGAPPARDTFSATARVGTSPLRVTMVTARRVLYGPVGGRRGWAPWLALALAALAMGAGLWLLARLRASHAALRRSEERYALALRAANDALWDWDLETGEVHFTERWQEMIGAAGEPGMDRWLERVNPEDRPQLEAAIAEHLAGETPLLDHEHRLKAAGGDWIWVRARGIAVFDDAGHAVRMAGSVSDVTARRRALDHLEHQATHDPLTGLANRAYFFSVLERSLERARRGEQPPCAVVFLDLDGFKLVNDRYGHVFGDAVLATVGGRLQHSVRPGDIVGRLGGDELAVLLPACPDAEEARMVAERLTAALAVPYEVLGEAIEISASAGIAVAAPDETAEELLREADAAMYRAKLAV